MVVFTCNNCGDSLQKPKVAKHYQFQCRSAENLTCVDCHKDFYGQEYVAHTKCITEAERYGGNNYVARPGQNKGERKQLAWLNIVKNVFDTAANLSHDERNVLNILSKHDNIPRKKTKFLNFIRNIMGHRVNMPVIENVWSRMENAFKEANPQPQTNANSTNKQESPVEIATSPTKNHENNIAENENNENICRAEQKGAVVTENDGSKKKFKKRKLTETNAEESEQAPKKKNRKTENEITLVPMTENIDDIQETSKFNWKATILEIVGSKEEVAVKKLRKKVIKRYLNHCTNSMTFEKATSKFDTKLAKITDIIIKDDKVTVACKDC